MDVLFTQDGAHFLLRWVHFLAGITWIGMLYYFNFVQTPFFKNAEAPVRSGMIRGVVPVALWWFRWGAMFTFLSGVGMIGIKAHAEGMTSRYMTLILTGGLLGTLMWANVWFIIWPAQKIVIASAEKVAKGGEAIAEAAARGARAGMVSRTNTLFSIPMLFFMGAASHLTSLTPIIAGNVAGYWIAVLIVAVLVEGNALMKPGSPTQKPLTSVQGTIVSGFVLTAVLVVLAATLPS
jgi:uncharacterized membrane protein